MKIAVIAVGVPVGLALLVIGIGALLPKEHTARRSALFKAAPERLFALIDGPQTWRSGIKNYALLGMENGRKRWEETDAHGQTICYEAVEREAPKLLRTRIVTEGLPYSGTWTLRLEPKEGATVLEITEQGEVYNPLFRFVSRFVIGQSGTIEKYIRDLAAATGEQAEVRR
jgi:hypothetical protein